MSTDPLAGSLAELGSVLYRRLLRNLSAADGDGSRLTIAQRMTLEALAIEGVLNIADLAERTGVAHSTSTRMVQGLERHGYVHQTTDPDDKRCRLIAITQDGRDALHMALEVMNRRIATLVDAVPPDERSDLTRGIQTLVRALRATDAGPPD